jgi:hypothetical protein
VVRDAISRYKLIQILHYVQDDRPFLGVACLKVVFREMLVNVGGILEVGLALDPFRILSLLTHLLPSARPLEFYPQYRIACSIRNINPPHNPSKTAFRSKLALRPSFCVLPSSFFFALE